MLGLGWPHLILFAIVALVLFGGKGKISDVMGDVAKGIKSFKKGLADDPDPAKSLDATTEAVVNKSTEKAKS